MNQAYQTNEAPQASKSINEIFLIETTRLIGVRVQGKDLTPKQPPRLKREQLAFPEPAEPTTEATAFLCSAERILSIYNKQKSKTQQRLTCTVKDWFKDTALKAGWNEVEFLENLQTGQIDGCMLRATNFKGVSRAQSQ
ncbi:hypothetical protein [Halopseudomonas sp.]|uniref:hypothetical protein n=1 Tax=Halopseudomonas sp. TaxID=2901191 RepID=UPI003001A096